MDRIKAKELIAALEKTLATFSETHGVKAKIKGNVTLGGSYLKAAVEIAEVGADGAAQGREAEALAHYFPAYVGLVIEGADGGKYKVTGYNTKADKFSFIGERIPDGKRFKFTLAHVKRFAPAEAAA